MNLNTEAKAQHTYDAIVVGSGISGGWAAKELCEKGLKVLLVERGRSVEHPNYPTTMKHPWEFAHRGRVTQSERSQHAIQARHFSYSEETRHWYVNDAENPYTEAKRYDWIRGDVVGGRSLFWGRQCYRWSDLDFGSNQRDGIGVDWPIRYEDLVPWYSYVERFIGVNGQPEGLPHLPDGIMQPPMEMNCVEKHFKAGVEEKLGHRITIGRSANLTAPVKGRGLCQYRNLCHRGCPYGAYFSTNASTLPTAFATGNLTLLPHSLVNRVLYDEQKGRATGVEVIDTETKTVQEYYARIIFLNASTLATSFILLNSASSRFPHGLGNGSDQVGRNLMDHHKCQGLTATVEGFEDSYYFGRRPNGLYIPRFRNLTGNTTGSYIRGFNYQGGASRTGWRGHVSGDAIGAELKAAVAVPGPWTMSFTGYGECLPYADNRVTLNTDVKDVYGRNTMTIDAEFKANEKNMQKDMVSSMGEMFDAMGFRNIRLEGAMSFPGNANHEMGTARMGRDPKTSVLNGFNQMHEVKNVFITDGSCMTSSSCVNPSLTYMALTARACAYAVDALKKQAL